MKTTVTTDVYVCDLCKAECGENDGEVSICVHPGDGRDVWPSYIRAKFFVYWSYGKSGQNTHICTSCRMKWLREYVAGFEETT